MKGELPRKVKQAIKTGIFHENWQISQSCQNEFAVLIKMSGQWNGDRRLTIHRMKQDEHWTGN